MTRKKGAMRWAGMFFFGTAILHVLALILGGFSEALTQHLVAGVIAVVCGFGLVRGQRWLGYLAFLWAFIAAIWAIGGIWSPGDVPGWLYACVTAANLIAAFALFLSLWRAPEATEA